VKDAQHHKLTRVIRYALSKQEFNPPFPTGVACSECRFAALDTPSGRFSVHVIFRQDCSFKVRNLFECIHNCCLSRTNSIISCMMIHSSRVSSSSRTTCLRARSVSRRPHLLPFLAHRRSLYLKPSSRLQIRIKLALRSALRHTIHT
jgi:hypothetical protein